MQHSVADWVEETQQGKEEGIYIYIYIYTIKRRLGPIKSLSKAIMSNKERKHELK